MTKIEVLKFQITDLRHIEHCILNHNIIISNDMAT